MRQRHEYEAVFAHNRVVSGRLYVVRFKPNGLSFARLGIIAARKALPRAVDRNRGKRVVREVFRQAAPRLDSWDIVVQLRPGIKQSDNAALRQELHELLLRARSNKATN
ncbi:MAG: ribonuclease P protein component [Burkholderiales bacterium]